MDYEPGTLKEIFISHSSADKDIALYIASDLTEANFNVWFDLWDLKLGHSIPKEIERGLDKADALVIILSKNYLKSVFCNDEWASYYMKYSSKPNKIIIPIIIDESEPPTMIYSKKYYRMR